MWPDSSFTRGEWAAGCQVPPTPSSHLPLPLTVPRATEVSLESTVTLPHPLPLPTLRFWKVKGVVAGA